jgi:PIN domain nuclease of toxin-antitoxin system
MTAIDSADVLAISAVSCCEVALLVEQGRLIFDRDVLAWIQHTLAMPRVTLLPLTPEIAVGAARLLWPYKDPADRLIMATSVIHHAPLITKDARIRRFQGVQTIW